MKKAEGRTRTLANGRGLLAGLFVFFFLLFGGLSWWVIWSMSQAARETDTAPASEATGNPYTPQDARTLLLITEDEGEAQGFVLIRMDPAQSRIRTLSIPRETALDSSQDSKRLFEVYETQKGAGIGTYVEEVTGIAVDFYAVLPYEGMEELLNQAGSGLSFTLPENLRYDMDGYTIRIDGGEQVLSATQVTDVLRYPAWNGGRQQRAAVQAQIISACINQYFTPATMENDAGYEACVAVADTNLLREPYYQLREPLAYMASRNTGTICQPLSVEGEYAGQGDEIRFYLQKPIGTAVRNAFDVASIN